VDATAPSRPAPVERAQRTDEAPVAAVTAAAATPEVAVTVTAPDPAPAATERPPARHERGGFVPARVQPAAAPVRAPLDVTAAAVVLVRTHAPLAVRPVSDAPVGVPDAPAPAAVSGGVAASAAASGPGVGLWLWFAAAASLAVFFCRVISFPAASRPVPYLSVLERPG
jgi:hypothetical protein